MNWSQSKLAVGTGLMSFVCLSPSLMVAQVELDPPNVQQLHERAAWHESETGKSMQGSVLDADVDFFEWAHQEIHPDGSAEWRLHVQVAGAPALCVYFDQFHLPVGTSLTLRTPASTFSTPFVEGPVDHEENNPHGRWVSGEIPGDRIELVYHQPAGVIGAPSMHIFGVGYFFQHLWFEGEYDLLGETGNRGSDPCQVDVNCPEGADWLCQRNSVARLRITQGGGIFLCSGAMVNNTARDCRQFLLSSFHCADEVEPDEWSLLKVRFNYEYIGCGDGGSINSHDRTGVYYITGSQDVTGGSINGSDFLLLEVEDPILASWEPFYSGWDATGIPALEGVGIHHPSGDRKKISTYTQNLSNSSAYHPGAHWRVKWASTETNHGVTEGGSSGSPIYNEDKRIVGTLTGGASFCESPNSPDYYGKFSYHWDGSNPIDNAEKLKHFLDPAGTGEEIMDGSLVGQGNLPCDGSAVCGIVEVEEEILAHSAFNLFPNPVAAGKQNVRLNLPSGIEVSELRVYDQMGRCIHTHRPADSANPQLQMTWTAGAYYITLETPSGVTSTSRLLVQ
ncbi:MAG: T9SS type A sorting domain-containing protein [Flavobacteriales bacterium]